MYKLLLSLRYLQTRYIALACIISVTLGVATMIVVNSVMAGFSTEMRDRIHGILADIIIESNTMDGTPNAEEQLKIVDQVVGQHVEGMTATVEVYGMLNFQYANQWITRPVTLIGIKPEGKSKVGPLVDYLDSYQEIRDGSVVKRAPLRDPSTPPGWELTKSAKEYRIAHKRQEWMNLNRSSYQLPTGNRRLPGDAPLEVPPFETPNQSGVSPSSESPFRTVSRTNVSDSSQSGNSSAENHSSNLPPFAHQGPNKIPDSRNASSTPNSQLPILLAEKPDEMSTKQNHSSQNTPPFKQEKSHASESFQLKNEDLSPNIFDQLNEESSQSQQTEEDFDPAEILPGRVYIGMGLVSFPVEDEETGNVAPHLMVQPGEDVKISTITSGRPPNPVHFNATVVDLFKSGMSEYDSNLVFCNLEYLQEVRGMIDPESGMRSVTSIQIKLNDYNAADEVVKELRGAFPPSMFSVRTWEQKKGPLLAAVEVESAILNVLLFLIIAVAGFGILAIFFMIVVEKTRDIGILKALGASSNGVMSIFLSYGLALGMVGSGVGVFLGLLFVKYINTIEDWITWLTGRKVFDQRIYYFPEIPTNINPMMVFLGCHGSTHHSRIGQHSPCTSRCTRASCQIIAI